MTAPALPYVPGAVRELLASAGPFLALVPAIRILTRDPQDVATPFVILKAPPAIPINASAGMWSPLIQVEGKCAPGGSTDPERVAWDIAALAAALLSRVRNRPYLTMHWTARVIDGPMIDIDTSRGDSAPIYRALIRAELTVHVR